MTRLYSACVAKHTLVHIVGDYWACECPAVFRRQGKLWLDPARRGLLEDILRMAEPHGGLHQMARRLERSVAQEQEARQAAHRRSGRVA